MIFKKLTLAACLFITFSLSAFAQEDSIPLRTLITKTTEYTQSFPAEKVYLHFDKPYYAVGDTIWFKAYVTLEQNQLSAISKIVYVDMINNRDSVVQSLKLPVVNGTAGGSIVLPQLTFVEGNYHVRAYTNWMRNFDQGYFFNKNITVGNISDKDTPVDTHISFVNAVTGTAEKITAHIIYKDQDGAPLTNRRISWKVQSDDETIDKGKGITDANGGVDITFTSDKKGAFASADLTSVIELNYKKSITNTYSLKTAAIAKDVQFFPEGGNMLSNVHAKVAFKAINSNGMGIDVKGSVTDDSNTEVAQFTSQHLGMGEFTFQPEANKNYKAIVSFPDGTKGTYDLPKELNEGIYISVINTNPDSVTIKLISNPAFLDKFKNTLFYIIAQSSGTICYAAQTNLQNLLYSSTIAKSKFPTGILQFSLLTSEGDPLSERLVFIHHDDLLNVAVNTDHPVYATRQKVHMNLSVKNKEVPDIGTFSLAVTDENKIPYNEDDETTILSTLLLTSDIKGYIEKPNYYFNHVDAKRIEDLDILMLTQGYHRFDYGDIVAGKTPKLMFAPEQGLSISGNLRTNAGIEVPHANIHLNISDRLSSQDAQTDLSGNYKFTNLNFKDSSKVVLNAKNNPNGNYLVITPDAETTPSLVKNINAPDNVQNIDSTLSVYLKNTKRQYAGTRMLKEVVVVAKSEVKKPSHLDYASLGGLSPIPDHVVSGSQLTGCNLLTQCLSTQIFGFTYDQGNFYLTRDYNAGNKSTPAAIYYNGLPVDANYLDNVDPKTVETVEVFLNDGLSSINKMSQTKGVIVVTGKKQPKGEKISLAQLKELMPKTNIITITPQGYARTMEFYVPKFSVPKTNVAYSDLRTTIYWNPKIITDATGKASFDFFNADGKGLYRVVLEGIDADGNIARYVYHYKVD
jgi:hypothetical protein